ncbi:MAG: 3-isopropylmalate dehydratase, partial [Gammaproteobacteria bacterium]|nr:3-isopropylmalate dehydratase [Gammaproteobacteria bacterium]
MPATLFDKLWESHCIETDDDGVSLLYMDRVVMHERTGSVALDTLLRRGRPVRRPEHVFCVVDHVVDTRPGRGDETQA